MADKKAVIQLLECAEDDLRRDIHRSSENIKEENEDTVINLMKTLSVKKENTMVARVRLAEMTQDLNEPIRTYAARVKSQAMVCKYFLTCTPHENDKQISYAEYMIKDRIVRGLSDLDIQQDVMAHEKQDITLEETLKLVEAKDEGK